MRGARGAPRRRARGDRRARERARRPGAGRWPRAGARRRSDVPPRRSGAAAGRVARRLGLARRGAPAADAARRRARHARERCSTCRACRARSAALVPTATGADLRVRRVADRQSTAPVFTPTLQRRAPRDALAYVAAGDLAATLQRLLVLGGTPAAGAVPRLIDAGGSALDTLGDVGRESAVVVSPSPEGPAVTVLARVRDAARARTAMRALEAPLAGLLGAPDGVVLGRCAPGRPARAHTARGRRPDARLGSRRRRPDRCRPRPRRSPRHARGGRSLAALPAFRQVNRDLPNRR